MPAAPSPHPPTPARPIGPNPPLRRLWLGVKLLLVPVAFVCLPSLFVSYFFGQRSAPTAPPDTALVPLRESLERAARAGLPEGTPTFGARFEDLSLPCPQAEAEARVDSLRGIVGRCDGVVTDQGNNDFGGRRFLVELPEANLPRFLGEVAPPAGPTPALPSRPPAAGGGGRVFLRVTLVLPPATP